LTAIDVMQLIEKSDQVACSALVKLFTLQTESERQSETTSEQNGVGFSYTDAPFLSNLAQQILANREKRQAGDPTAYPLDLSPRQLDAWRKVAPKYARQLTAVANGADPATYRLPKAEPKPEEPAEETAPAETPMEFARNAVAFDQQTRIDRALREGGGFVWTQHDPTSWQCEVQSGNTYLIDLQDGTCTCADFLKRASRVNGQCKHLAALQLTQAARLEEERRQMRERCSWISDDLLARVFGR
jgi:predicted nucleic acid-binding Zn finger protein